MGQDTSIVVSADDVKAFEKLKIISYIAPLKERIRSFERKYGLGFGSFEDKMKSQPEDFESWDDFIEWKAYTESLKDLEIKLKNIDDVKDIRIAPG